MKKAFQTGNGLGNGTVKDHLWGKNRKYSWKSKQQPDHEGPYMSHKGIFI